MTGRLNITIVITLALCAAAVLAVSAARTAPPAGAPAGGSKAVRFETVPNSDVKRIVLASRAAGRLGIELAQVTEGAVPRRQIVGGLVVPPVEEAQPGPRPDGGLFGGYARVPPATSIVRTADAVAPAPPAAVGADAAASAPSRSNWVRVALSAGEWERIAKGRPARIVPLATRADASTPIVAEPAKVAPLEDARRSMLHVYYVLPGDEGLEMHQRMRVELELEGDDKQRLMVPYSAIYYDGRGKPWVYVSPAPLTYVRERVVIDRIAGDMALLSDGPASGTNVVQIGAALLFGTEVFGK